MIKRFLYYFIFLSVSSFILITNLPAEMIINGTSPDKLPPREKCADCHDIMNIYNELTTSVHKDLKCFECHVPGRVQIKKYDEKALSFYRLGYYKGNGDWVEVPGNEVCLRCHENQTMKSVSEKCWSCHMIQDGVDNVIIVKDKQKPRTQENIKDIRKYPHKSHSFSFHTKG